MKFPSPPALLVLLVLSIFGAQLSMPLASAGTISKGSKKSPAVSTEPDSYNPSDDPLPEWLLLPLDVDENSLQFDGDPMGTQMITSQQGANKWVIINAGDGRQVTYQYYESNLLQFYVRTTADYKKVALYNEHNKRIKSVDGDIFFDESIDLATYNLNKQVASAARACNGSGTERSCYPPKAGKARTNTKLSNRQINKLTHKAGFRGGGAKIANAIIKAESRGRVGEVLCNTSKPYNPDRKFVPGVKECSKRDASADRGVFQINNHWHKNVSNNCSFSSRCNAKSAYKISNGGRDWTPWSTYQNGLYKQYL